MFLRALLVGYVIGLGATFLLDSRAAEKPIAAAMVQKQRQAEPDARFQLLRLDRPAR